MHQRVAEASSEKTARERLQEEAESTSRTIKKLQERQEALAMASNGNVTASEWQMKEERDKLLVCHRDPPHCHIAYTSRRNSSVALVVSKTSSSKSLSSACTVCSPDYGIVEAD